MQRRVSIFLGILQMIVAIGAIPAGISMMMQPDGSGIGMSVEMLSGSPFKDFLIPAIILFVVNGVFNIFGAIASFSNYRHSCKIGMALGIFLVAWILIQIYFVGFSHISQPLYLFVGIVEVLLSYLLIKNRRPNIPI